MKVGTGTFSARWAFVLSLTIVSPALAEVGGLVVRVLDAADGSPILGAMVVVTSDRWREVVHRQASDAEGRAEFPVLPVGEGYTVEVLYSGYARTRLDGIVVRSEKSTPIEMRLGSEMRESLTVEARPVVIELDRVGETTRFGDEFIDQLPIQGRFYQRLLALAPGVKDADDDGNPNVHGARSRDFKATVGGVSNVDPLTGEWMSFVNPDTIQEMEIVTAGAGAEFGRAQGGFARIIQKQGSNDFEGVFSLLFRTSKLDGAAASDYFRSAGLEYEWLQPSISLSGPIVRDRLWYRLSHEIIRREDPIDVLTRVAIVDRQQEIHADQLTWQVSPRNKLALQYQADPLKIENFELATNVGADSTRTFERGGTTWTLAWSAPVSSRLFLETTAAYQNHEVDLVPSTTNVTQNCLLFREPYTALNSGRCLNADQSQISGSHFESSRDERQRLTIDTRATHWIPEFLGMSHRIKVGLSVENERYFRDLRRGPDMIFDEPPPTLGPRLADVAVRITVPPEVSTRTVGTNWGVWFEDQLKPRGNLALTLGLRVDREELNGEGFTPFDPRSEARLFDELDLTTTVQLAMARAFTAYESLGNFQELLAAQIGVTPDQVQLGPGASQSAFWNTQRGYDPIAVAQTNLSPRVSVSWDPGADGKTRIFASAGRYYDKIFLAVPGVEIEPPFTVLNFAGLYSDGRFTDNGLNSGLNPSASIQIFDRNIGTPYQDEWTIGIERELWPETSLKATWIHRRFEDQLQDVETNHRTGDLGRCVRPLNPASVVVVQAPGISFYADPYSGEQYLDSDPGPGDGRIDDCTGDLGGVGLGAGLQTPDGLPDLYALNPGWGDLLLVGNFNRSAYSAGVIELIRRLHRDWEVSGSYTWSRAKGDAEDYDQVLGNESTLREDERGFLSYDQRHAIRLSAVTLVPGRWRLGGTLRWESGTPYSTLDNKRTILAIPPVYGGLGDRGTQLRLRYPSRQRNDQRNPAFWGVDLRVAREFQLRDLNLQVTAEVFNLLDDDTLTVDDITNGNLNGTRRPGRSYQIGTRLAF